MFKRKSFIKKTEPKNHYCIQCAIELQCFIEASVMTWDEESKKVIPLCDHHFSILQEIDETIYRFNLN